MKISDKVKDNFMWDDEFTYSKNDHDKEISTKLYIIASRAIGYANNYRIDYEVNDDNYFRSGFCIF